MLFLQSVFFCFRYSRWAIDTGRMIILLWQFVFGFRSVRRSTSDGETCRFCSLIVLRMYNQFLFSMTLFLKPKSKFVGSHERFNVC